MVLGKRVNNLLNTYRVSLVELCPFLKIFHLSAIDNLLSLFFLLWLGLRLLRLMFMPKFT